MKHLITGGFITKTKLRSEETYIIQPNAVMAGGLMSRQEGQDSVFSLVISVVIVVLMQRADWVSQRSPEHQQGDEAELNIYKLI